MMAFWLQRGWHFYVVLERWDEAVVEAEGTTRVRPIPLIIDRICLSRQHLCYRESATKVLHLIDNTPRLASKFDELVY